MSKRALQEQTAGREFVYFIRCAGRIKIGYSGSLPGRLSKMFTDLPADPEILHIEDADRRTEKILHREFAALRERGEWFRADISIYEHIRRRCLILQKPLPKHVAAALGEAAE